MKNATRLSQHFQARREAYQQRITAGVFTKESDAIVWFENLQWLIYSDPLPEHKEVTAWLDIFAPYIMKWLDNTLIAGNASLEAVVLETLSIYCSVADFRLVQLHPETSELSANKARRNRIKQVVTRLNGLCKEPAPIVVIKMKLR